MDKLSEAIKYFDDSKRQMAEALGVLPQHINNWKLRGVPPDKAKAIEIATNGVITRADLRPDIFE